MALDVEHVDFLVLENARLHRTDRYELVHLESSTAVLRRGQHFKVNIDFQGRKYDHATDLVRLHFSFGMYKYVINQVYERINFKGSHHCFYTMLWYMILRRSSLISASTN